LQKRFLLKTVLSLLVDFRIDFGAGEIARFLYNMDSDEIAFEENRFPGKDIYERMRCYIYSQRPDLIFIVPTVWSFRMVMEGLEGNPTEIEKFIKDWVDKQEAILGENSVMLDNANFRW